MLQIYNTLTRQKELFKPINANKIGLYVCGITVYDYCHLGHARTYVAFDIIIRYLQTLGYAVNYIRNITDIDDKIINRAKQNNEPFTQLTARFIQAMHEDFTALNILPATAEPRATDYIDAMISLIKTLIAKNLAYVGDNGDVYYSVAKFTNYGCLAHQDLEKLQSGSRVAVSDAKQEPLDFVLWKLSNADEPAWQSPWGMGRPGWHIECSAMALKCLGNTFDLHGGGFDLTFPHHENEIAQSEGATGEKFVNHWLHVGFLQIDKEKMSKSLGNFSTIREVLAQWPAEVLRYFLTSSHYRGPLNYSLSALENAKAALSRLYIAIRGFKAVDLPENASYQTRFYAAMNDDFNTAEALAVLFDLAREINRLRTENELAAASHAALLRKLANILGLLNNDPEHFLQQVDASIDKNAIESLIEQRNAARKAKDWAQADFFRKQLTDLGIVIEDSVQGTTWRKLD